MADNTKEDMMVGKYVFNYALGFYPPISDIQNNLWYDPNLILTTFGS